MNVIEYARGVKTFKEGEILESLLNVKVAVLDIKANLMRMQSNHILLVAESERWIVSKGVMKHLKARGFTGNTLVEAVLYETNVIESLLPELTKLVQGYKEKIWDGKLLTVRQLNLLNMIEHLLFWCKYTRMVFDVLLTNHLKGQDPAQYLDKVDFRWINGTEMFYRTLSADLFSGSRAMITNLNNVPDVEASQTSLDVLESMEGAQSVDALKQGFGVHLVNPMFWVSLLWSKINIMRIEKMRRENELFAMKVSQAVNKQNGGDDPQLERQIEIYQNEIIKNQDAIERIEASYA
jgi:hypothetical protein